MADVPVSYQERKHKEGKDVCLSEVAMYYCYSYGVITKSHIRSENRMTTVKSSLCFGDLQGFNSQRAPDVKTTDCYRNYISLPILFALDEQ